MSVSILSDEDILLNSFDFTKKKSSSIEKTIKLSYDFFLKFISEQVKRKKTENADNIYVSFTNSPKKEYSPQDVINELHLNRRTAYKISDFLNDNNVPNTLITCGSQYKNAILYSIPTWEKDSIIIFSELSHSRNFSEIMKFLSEWSEKDILDPQLLEKYQIESNLNGKEIKFKDFLFVFLDENNKEDDKPKEDYFRLNLNFYGDFYIDDKSFAFIESLPDHV